MTFVQATTGGGGWPMSVFMTPEQKPFFGGTYFRKPDFMNLCKRVDELWNDKEMRSKLEGDAERMATELAKISVGTPDPNAKLHSGMVTNAIARIKDTYDPRFGGFGRAPKFPRPPNLSSCCSPSEPRIKTASAWSHIPAIKWPPAASMINSVAASPATPSTNAG